MSSDYKLRLPDGSEIGPLSLDDVKSWYARGLVGPDDMVWKPSGARWVPLRQVMPADALRPISSPGSPSAELRSAARAAAKPRPSPAGRKAASAADESEVDVEVQGWRTVLVGVCLLLVAAGAGALVFLPDRWLPALDDAPWREIALGAAALGLLLIRGWELARKIVRVVLLIAAAALFPVLGILVAQGVRGAGLVVVASALLLFLGLIASLAHGWLPLWRVAAGLVLVLAGAAGIVRFGVVPESEGAAQVRDATQPDRRFQDAAHGARLDLPPGWVVLKPQQTLVPAPPGTWLVLAHPRQAGFALIGFEASPVPMAEDAFLERVLARRQVPRTRLERSDLALGALRARQELSRSERDGAPWLDLTAVAKDGRTYASLVAWLPDDGSARPQRELQALASSLVLDGRAAAELATAVRRATDDVPCLSSAAAEMVMAGAEAPVLDPPRTFRRAVQLAERGRAHLSASEVQEFEELNSSACALLPKSDRERLLAYLERIRAARPAAAEDDAGMSALMKRAALSLSPSERGARLQALYEKAIRAAVDKT